MRRETVDPFTGGDGLAGIAISTERSPVTSLFIVFVGDRAFDDQDEVFDSSSRRVVEGLEKIIAVGLGKKWIVERDFRNPGNLAEDDVFDAGLGGSSHGDGVAVTAQAGGDPQNVELGYRVLAQSERLQRSTVGHHT